MIFFKIFIHSVFTSEYYKATYKNNVIILECLEFHSITETDNINISFIVLLIMKVQRNELLVVNGIQIHKC